jgi:hypothetical protein
MYHAWTLTTLSIWSQTTELSGSQTWPPSGRGPRQDGSIPIQDVDYFAARRERHGNDVEYLRYEKLGHNLLYNPAVKLEIFRSMERLLERRLQ